VLVNIKLLLKDMF